MVSEGKRPFFFSLLLNSDNSRWPQSGHLGSRKVNTRNSTRSFSVASDVGGAVDLFVKGRKDEKKWRINPMLFFH